MTVWAQIVNAALGVWLMAAPAVLEYGEPARTNDRIAGPLAASFAIVAIWAVTRRVGRANVGIGLWLLLAPWVLGYHPGAAVWNSLAVGVALAGCGLVQGRPAARMGGGWAAALPRRGAGGP